MQMFSLKYNLAPQQFSSGLSTGAIAGIAVGGAAIIAFLAALLLFLRHRRVKSRNNAATTTATSTFSGPTERGDLTHISSVQPSELPSPAHATLPDADTLWYPMPLVVETPVKKGPPMELEGDTFIHEHHPAHSPTEEEAMARQREQNPAGFQGDPFMGSAMGGGGQHVADDGVSPIVAERKQ